LLNGIGPASRSRRNVAVDAGARLPYRDRTPRNGYEATPEAAMAAFAKSWRRERLDAKTPPRGGTRQGLLAGGSEQGGGGPSAEGNVTRPVSRTVVHPYRQPRRTRILGRCGISITGVRSPMTTPGFEPTREAAMAAFAKSWRRE